MKTTLTLFVDEAAPRVEVDLDRLKAALEVKVREAILGVLRQRLNRQELGEEVISQCDVHLDVSHLSWLGGRIEWDCLVIVDGLRAERGP